MPITFANTGTGGVPNSTVVRTRQNGSSEHIQGVDVSPMVPTSVSGGQYAFAVTTTVVRQLTVPSGATHAWISVDPSGGAVRWTRDGTVPTSANGHYLAAGDAVEMDNLSNFRCIASGSAATLQISYHQYS